MKQNISNHDNRARKTKCKSSKAQGAWVVQLVEHLTLDFGSGHDLTVCELEPHIGLQADSAESAWDSLSLSLSLLLSCSRVLSLSLQKINLKKKKPRKIT